MNIRHARCAVPLLLAALLGIALSGCRPNVGSQGARQAPGQASALAGRRIRIGYSFYNMKIPWVVSYRKAFEDGMQKHPDYEIAWLDAGSDTRTIAAAVSEWTQKRFDLVVSMSPDHVPLRSAYGKALDAGIPVLLTGESPDYRVYASMTAFSGFSSWDAGRMAAELLSQTLGGKGRIACITGPRGSASEQQSTEGFRAALERLASKLQIVALEDGRWEPTASYQKTLSILERFPTLDGIFVSEDAMASAVIRALKQKGYTAGQVKVVAQGGSRAALADLTEGWYTGILNQDPSLAAQQDVWLIRSLVEDHRRVPRVAQVPQETIARESAGRNPGW